MGGLPEVRPLDAEPRVEISRPRPDVAIVVLLGEHDLESTPRLEHTLGEELLTCSELVVDLSPAQFIDSSTIHALVDTKREADKQNRRFTLVLDGSPNIEHTLEICGVLGTLNRVTSLETAIRRMAATDRGATGTVAAARSQAWGGARMTDRTAFGSPTDRVPIPNQSPRCSTIAAGSRAAKK